MTESPASSSAAAAAAANSSSAPTHIEYSSEAELLTEFRKFMRDPSNLEIATNYLYNSLLDETILGVAYEMHYTLKTGLYEALEGIPEDSKPFSIVDMPDIDIFGASNAKIAMVCTCPKCFQGVSASRFAPHMEKCMGKCTCDRIEAVSRANIGKYFIFFVVVCSGMGRNSFRIASRRIASTRDNNNSTTYFGTTLTDDEDDADWSGEKRRKKIQPIRSNGTKKNGKSSSWK